MDHDYHPNLKKDLENHLKVFLNLRMDFEIHLMGNHHYDQKILINHHLQKMNQIFTLQGQNLQKHHDLIHFQKDHDLIQDHLHLKTNCFHLQMNLKTTLLLCFHHQIAKFLNSLKKVNYLKDIHLHLNLTKYHQNVPLYLNLRKYHFLMGGHLYL